MPIKIISGGQTGADQAALDYAIQMNIPHGGWIPKGRLTEDGPLPKKYDLQEMPTKSYPKRTEKNIIESDGTLIISHGTLTGGSELTRKLANKHNKPFLHIDMDSMEILPAVHRFQTWLTDNGIKVLNVAGSRASEDPRIYLMTTKILELSLAPST